VNKAMLIGRLGQEPEVRYTKDRDPVTNFSLATSHKSKDQEYTEWHRIVSFGKLAEICGQYLTKGKLVMVEGRIHTKKWQDKEGKDRYTTEIVAAQVEFLSGKEG